MKRTIGGSGEKTAVMAIDGSLLTPVLANIGNFEHAAPITIDGSTHKAVKIGDSKPTPNEMGLSPPYCGAM